MQVYDNLFSKEEQDKIESIIFGETTKWSFNRGIAYKNNPEVSQEYIDKLMSFSCPVVAGDKVLDDTNLELYLGMLERIKNVLPIDFVFNIRTQLQLPVVTDVPVTPHIDSHMIDKYNYKVILYYVNDSEGDTLFYDRLATDDNKLDLKVIHRVQPKKGRVVIFNGDVYHSSSRPSNSIRCVINFNVILET